MTIQDKKNKSSPWAKGNRERSGAYGSSSGEGSFREDSPGNNKNFGVRASGEKWQSSYGGGDVERGSQTNEWQPVGNSDVNVKHWWDSGTRQQQQFFGGDAQYPYRENGWERSIVGQTRIQNFYPREPASGKQRENFAAGSQYPYEGGYGAENLLAREGLERAKKLKGPADSGDRSYEDNSGAGRVMSQQIEQGSQGYGNGIGGDWQQNQFRNQNQITNQNQNTMRSDDRNYRGDFNDYRNEEYDRGRGRSRDRGYGNGRSMADREYDRVRFYQHQDVDRDRGGYDRRPDFERDARQYSDYNENRRFDNDESGAPRGGRYHSSRTDVPGRGFNREREMQRHENNRRRDRFIDDRGYHGDRNYRVFSSHRTTGSYDDFERDIDRYGVRDNYEERGFKPGRGDYGRGRERNENRGSYGRFEEKGDRRGANVRMQSRGIEGSQEGDWRDSDYRRDGDLGYNSRYEDERNHY